LKIKILVIILAAVVFVGAAVGIGIIIYNNTPQNVAKNAVMGVFNDFGKREEIAPLTNMIKKGSLEVSMNKFYSEEGSVEDTPFKLSGKMYFSDKAFMLDKFKFQNNANDFKLAGSLYVSEDKMYLEETEIFDTIIGIVKGEAAEDFEDSIFAYDSGSDYSIPDEDAYDQIVSALESFDSKRNDNLKNDAKRILSKYINKAWEIFCQNAEFEAESTSVKLNGTKENARVVTVSFDQKDIAHFLEGFYEFLANDKDVINFLEKYEQELSSADQLLEGSDYDSLAEAYEEFIEEFEDTVDDWCDNITESKTNVEIEIVTPNLSSMLLKLTLNVNKNEVFSIDFGTKGIKSTNMITIETAGTEIVYEIVKDDAKKYESVLTVNDSEVFSYTVNKSKETMTIDIGDGAYVIEGTVSVSGEVTKMAIKKISMYDGSSVYKTDLTITVDQNDKMPTPEKEFDRISDIDDDDIEGWGQKLQEAWD